MAKKGKEAADPDAKSAAVRSLFSADNPFRRKEGPAEEPAPPAAPATPVQKQPKAKLLPAAEAEVEAPESSRKKRKEEDGERPARRKRKRDEVEAGYERRRLGAAPPAEEPAPRPVVGKKRKAPDDVAVATAGGAEEEEEAFDDEDKLLRTVFVGNLPLRTKKKALAKEFAAFGEVESVRIRSVPLGDVSTVSLNSFYVVESFGFVC